MRGQADARIIDVCGREDRVLLTLDLDFAKEQIAQRLWIVDETQVRIRGE
jgi:predicted nuclease of predicted toxin-antitoxin system